jgi:hypothetical protein
VETVRLKKGQLVAQENRRGEEMYVSRLEGEKRSLEIIYGGR